MRYALPFLMVALVFIGGIVCNRVYPLVGGVPMFVAWNVFSVLLISAGMWVIFRLDPENKKDEMNGE
jgi:hypothetical protein